MGRRIRLGAWHLLSSAAVFSCAMAVLYFNGYAWPNWYLMGAEQVVAMAALVDLCLGPSLTMVVSGERKPLRELRRDIAVIAVIQLFALGYAVHTLWNGRPLVVAFSADRAELVPAAAFDPVEAPTAQRLGQRFIEGGPAPWVWAPLPDNPVEREEIVMSALSGGRDVTAMPRRYRSIAEARQALRGQVLTVAELARRGAVDHDRLLHDLAALGHRPEALVALPVQGRARDGVFLLDLNTLEPLTFWSIDPWRVPR